MFRGEAIEVPARRGSVAAAPNGNDPRVGRYQIIEKVGEGAMGVVYRALDPAIQRVVAVKMMSSGLDDDPTMRERFFREARSAGQLSQRNIVTIYELGEEQGRAYIVMEFLEGENLRRRISRRHPMSLDEKLRIMIEVCMGVAHAHSKDVVHRDLKPDNIFIAKDGVVKILDFGLARGSTSDVTKAGTVMGTPSYMSPEQVKGLRVDARSDIFSTGAVFYELLASRKPFEAPSFAATFYKILNEEPEPIERVDPSVPAELSRIVSRALRKAPEQRYQSSEEFLQELTDFRKIRREALAEHPSGPGSQTKALVTANAQRPAADEEPRRVSPPEPLVQPAAAPVVEQVGALRTNTLDAPTLSGPVQTDRVLRYMPMPKADRSDEPELTTAAPLTDAEDVLPHQSMLAAAPLRPPFPTRRLALMAAVLLAVGAAAGAVIFIAPEKTPGHAPPTPAATAPGISSNTTSVKPASTTAAPPAVKKDSSSTIQTDVRRGTDGRSPDEPNESRETTERIAMGKRDAAALVAQGRYAEALDAVSAVLKADPSDKEAKVLDARVNNELRASADTAMKQAGTARARAEEAGAALAAADLYSMSKATEKEARQLYDSGGYVRSADLYRAAAGTYRQAMEAANRVPRPIASPEKGSASMEHGRAEPPAEPPPARSGSPPVPASGDSPRVTPPAAPQVGSAGLQPQHSQPPTVDGGDEREEVNQMLQRYARALESKDMDLVLSIWPTLGPVEQRRVQESFKFTRSHVVSISIAAIHLDGSSGTVTCDRVDQIVTVDGQKVPSNRSQPTFVVRRTADGWTIVSVR